MSEKDADIVMLGLDYLEDQITDNPDPSLSQLVPRKVLAHLYQLHQLRDAAIYSDLRHMCALARDTITLLKIDEMYCGS